MHKESKFKTELVQAIKRQIKQLKDDDTTGMSVENLFMIVRHPSMNLKGAPVGTNARYYYRQMFEDVCKEKFSDFLV